MHPDGDPRSGAARTFSHLRIIPYFRPTIGETEIDAVRQVLCSGWLTTGPRVAEFERAFARYVQAEHSIAVSSGTAALHLALEAWAWAPAMRS